jgi:prepilin-type processing-associated H-X9-DG protein
LVELLVVIAIIGVLAALLLPTLAGGKKRALRVVCERQLQQIGIAFQSFAHDHNSKFPMQVAAGDGGSREYAQSDPTNGIFPTNYRHFQALAGGLDTPRVLVCPADSRLPAVHFSTLQNSNVSYFVGLDSRYDQPMSILAGDGNLAASSDTILGAAGGRLTWNRQQHEYQGNVLFADGHVEGWRDMGGNTLAGRTVIDLPSLATDGSATEPGSANRPGVATQTHDQEQDQDTGSAMNAAAAPEGAESNRPAASGIKSPVRVAAQAGYAVTPTGPAGDASELDVSNQGPQTVAAVTNPPSGRVTGPGGAEAAMSPFDRELAQFLRDIIVGTYLLVLLLMVIYAGFRIWRWHQGAERRRYRRRQ